MPETPGRKHLHRHPRIEQREGIAEVHAFCVETAAEDPEVPPPRFEAAAPGSETARRQVRRQRAVLRGPAGVERLGHRPETQPDARSEAGGDAERHLDPVPIQTGQFRRGRGGPQRSRGGGRVEPFPVVARVDRFGDLALHLETEEEGFEQRGAARPDPLPHREAGRERRDGGVREQPEDAVRSVRELRVVEVHRVPRRAVRPRRERRRRPQRRIAPENARFRRPSLLGEQVANQARTGLGGPGEHHADAVGNAAPAFDEQRLGQVLERGFEEETGNGVGRAHSVAFLRNGKRPRSAGAAKLRTANAIKARAIGLSTNTVWEPEESVSARR